MVDNKALKPTILQRLSLYDIALEGKLIEDILIEGDGELTPETEARMDALLVSGKPKIEGACLIIKELEASEENAKKEADRLTARRKSFERNADGLKRHVAQALDSAFSGKVKTDRVTAYTQKSADKVQVDFLAEAGQLENLFNAHPHLVVRETVYSLNVDAVRDLWEEERPARDEYAAALDEYGAAMDAMENGEMMPESMHTLMAPQEPDSAIPKVIAVEDVPGRRFLQIR
jgi:hypothetical protein